VARTRVKICGITRAEDGTAAARLGADAIGLVFYGASPRAVDPAAAQDIVRTLPAFVTVAALFVDPTEEQVARTLEAVAVDVLQFHGSEPPEFCAGFGRRYIKAVRMAEGADLDAAARRYADACGLLVDAYDPDLVGGSGRTFDWTRLPDDLPLPLILAGGLTAGNVAAAVAAVRPWGVDVSSGVEQDKGVKDAQKMANFIDEVRRGEQA